MITQEDILRLTFYGLSIYAYILGIHHKKGIYLETNGRACKPARNPFNGDKETLHISQQEDDVFCYQDIQLAEFKGNPFDFAALYYQLSGDKLLEKINQDLNLHLGTRNNSYDLYVGKKPIKVSEIALPRFSFFLSPISNLKPYAQITLKDVYKLIKGKRYRTRTEHLRSLTDPGEAGKYKQDNLEYVTFSGIFSKRGNKSLLHPSGLLVFDFDKVNDLPLLRKTLLDDPLFVTVMLFKSPSGNGLKWIIEVDLNQCSHKEWFESVADYLDTSLQIKVDRSGKDISRACFLCHDPDVYIHPDYLQDSAN